MMAHLPLCAVSEPAKRVLVVRSPRGTLPRRARARAPRQRGSPRALCFRRLAAATAGWSARWRSTRTCSPSSAATSTRWSRRCPGGSSRRSPSASRRGGRRASAALRRVVGAAPRGEALKKAAPRPRRTRGRSSSSATASNSSRRGRERCVLGRTPPAARTFRSPCPH